MMRKIKVDGEPQNGIHPLQTASLTFEPRCVCLCIFNLLQYQNSGLFGRTCLRNVIINCI